MLNTWLALLVVMKKNRLLQFEVNAMFAVNLNSSRMLLIDVSCSSC
jgi:hypothetical protein